MKAMRIWICLAMLGLSALAQAQPKSPAAKQPLSKPLPEAVLWNFRSLGLIEKQAQELERMLRRAINQTKSVQLLQESTAAQRLKEAHADRSTQPEETAAALRVTWIISGGFGGLGEEISVHLKLLDGRTGQEIRRVANNLPTDPALMSALLEELVVQLLLPDKWVGSLKLDIVEAGAKVYLDGIWVATSPVSAPLEGLIPGKHILVVNKEGYKEFSQFIEIRYNQTAHPKLDLDNATVAGLIYEQKQKTDPAPPLPDPTKEKSLVVQDVRVGEKWSTAKTLAFWGAVAGIGVAGGGWLLGVSSQDVAREVELTRWTTDNASKLQARLRMGERRAKAATGMIISGGVLTAGSLLLFFLLDRPEPANAPSSSLATIAPAPVPGGGGLYVSGRF